MNHATVPPKILVVDDSDDTRDMMAKLLEMESFVVITAPDGNAGIYVATTEHPDLIITDINMPNLNGIEMIKQLRQRPGFESIPIMAITAYGDGVAQDAIDAGANLAATKPVQFKSLAVNIRELLHKSLMQRSPEPPAAE
jgi:CheY-like chemotaxis protein